MTHAKSLKYVQLQGYQMPAQKSLWRYATLFGLLLFVVVWFASVGCLVNELGMYRNGSRFDSPISTQVELPVSIKHSSMAICLIEFIMHNGDSWKFRGMRLIT